VGGKEGRGSQRRAEEGSGRRGGREVRGGRMPVKIPNLSTGEPQERGCPLAPRVGRRGAEEEPSCGARGRQTDLCLQQGRECGALVRSYLECMEGRQGSSAESLFLPGHGLAQAM